MNTIQVEQDEYNKFIGGLIEKANEVQRDFKNLSLENQKKVYSELGRSIQIETIIELIQQINNR